MDSEGTLAPLTDREVERILSGRLPEERSEVDALLAYIEALRSSRADRPPRPDAALAAVFTEGLPADLPPPPAWAIPPDPEPEPGISRRRSRWTIRRPRLRTAVNAMLGTLVGKVVFGATLAVASVGGAHAAGVIDVPRLPDLGHALDDATADDGRDPSGQAADRTPAAGPAAGHHGTGAAGGRNARTGDADHVPDAQSGQGVDGGQVSDRATSGASRQDGEAFGRTTAEDAVGDAPAGGLADDVDAGPSGRSDDRGSAGTADVRAEQEPPDPPAAPAESKDARKGSPG